MRCCLKTHLHGIGQGMRRPIAPQSRRKTDQQAIGSDRIGSGRVGSGRKIGSEQRVWRRVAKYEMTIAAAAATCAQFRLRQQPQNTAKRSRSTFNSVGCGCPNNPKRFHSPLLICLYKIREVNHQTGSIQISCKLLFSHFASGARLESLTRNHGIS